MSEADEWLQGIIIGAFSGIGFPIVVIAIAYWLDHRKKS